MLHDAHPAKRASSHRRVHGQLLQREEEKRKSFTHVFCVVDVVEEPLIPSHARAL